MEVSASCPEGHYPFGHHRARFEPPDTMFLYFDGPVEVQHFEEIYAKSMQLIGDRRIYFVRDGHDGKLDPKTRSAIIKTMDPGRVAAVISYGSSFQSRVILTMLVKAMRRFRQAAPMIVFVESEAEARAWISSHRKAVTNLQR
jgi:hypothetical protein